MPFTPEEIKQVAVMCADRMLTPENIEAARVKEPTIDDVRTSIMEMRATGSSLEGRDPLVASVITNICDVTMMLLEAYVKQAEACARAERELADLKFVLEGLER